MNEHGEQHKKRRIPVRLIGGPMDGLEFLETDWFWEHSFDVRPGLIAVYAQECTYRGRHDADPSVFLFSKYEETEDTQEIAIGN